MEQVYINLGELKDFIQDNNLMDMYSNIRFKALVSIKTIQKEIRNQEMNVRVTFQEGYGKITLLEESLDPYQFPSEFEAQWQKMEYKENLYLYITDTHKKNPSIGKYEVKIIPIPK